MAVASHLLDMSDEDRERYYADQAREAARRKAEKEAKREAKKK